MGQAVHYMLYRYQLIIILETNFTLIKCSYPYFTNEEKDSEIAWVTQPANRLGLPSAMAADTSIIAPSLPKSPGLACSCL